MKSEEEVGNNIKLNILVFRLFIPVVCYYSISIDKVGKSKHNKPLLRYKESKDKQHVTALFIIRPSSGLTCRTKEESQCYMVHKFTVCYN